MHDLLQHLVQWRLLPLGSVEFVSVEFALFLLLQTKMSAVSWR